MDISTSLYTLNSISLTLLAVAPSIFVFSVTLLGTAIEKTQLEEKTTRENDRANLQNEIVKIEQSIKKVKKNNDLEPLTKTLQELKDKQKESEKKIEGIKLKYSQINLLNSVVYPCTALIIVLVTDLIVALFVALIFHSINLAINVQVVNVIVFLLKTSLIFYALKKLYRGLHLVEEISSNKKESEMYSKVKEVIKQALSEHQQDNREEVTVEIVDKAFPLNTTTSTEIDLRLRIRLAKGTVLQNASVWFFVEDGFELINPNETTAWRQSSDYETPNIRTVKIDIGRLSVGPYTPREIKIKTPADPGKYLLQYKVFADGYNGVKKDLWLHVG